MKTLLRFPKGLYGITPEWSDFNALSRAVEQAAHGGMVALQWRQKQLTGQEALDKAGRLRVLCRHLGVVYIVNDDIELALAVDADGVHLGRDDPDLKSARQRLGAEKIIGCSCYNEFKRAEQALSSSASYVAFGAVYPSSVKPGAVQAELSMLRKMHHTVCSYPAPRPSIVAIGGITPKNGAAVVQAGADSLAVINGLFQAPDITTQAHQFAQLFTP